MNRSDLVQLRDAAGPFNELMAKIDGYLTRTYPNVTRRGSQHNEEEILRDLLPGDVGTYVDFGAGEPVQCSNTWAFYERGWRGLLVEPLFWYWPALLHQRPGDYLYDVALRHYTGITPLRVDGTVSSVLPTWKIAEQCNMIVACETAADVLAKFPAVRDACRLCSIDVEGVEGEVLQSIDWTTFRPEVFVIEYRTYHPEGAGADLSGDWAHVVLEQGYEEVMRNNLNVIFKRTTAEETAAAEVPEA